MNLSDISRAFKCTLPGNAEEKIDGENATYISRRYMYEEMHRDQ